MAETVNYSGRDTDILCLHGWKPEGQGEALMHCGIADAETRRSSVVTGIMKLSQIFTIIFLTERGSSEFSPEFGTLLMRNLRSGFIRSGSLFQSSIYSAISQVKRQMGQQVRDRLSRGQTVPDDEILEDAKLRSYTLTDDGASISIQLISRAGYSRDVVLPISVS